MSRDLKPKRQSNASSKKKSGGGTLVGLFIGLILGVVCAAAVVIYIQKAPLPFTTNGHVATPAQPVGQAPLPLPGKPGDPVPQADKPRFEFYKILPGESEAVPENKPEEKAATTEQKPKEADKKKPDADVLKEPVFLQAGSFQNAADADNQKAKLALLGVEASVQQVMVQDKVWFRVRLGPFHKLDEVNSMRSDLAKQGVDVAVAKKD